MAIALDSDAVIAFLDRNDALHAAARKSIGGLLAAGEPLVVSVVTFSEVLAGAKLGHHDEDVVRGFFRDLVGETVPVDSSVGERAADLRSQRPSLRMPDALILATADLHTDVERLVCGDRQATKIDALRCEVDLLESEEE